ncbi:hypothetical protein [Cohnella mopanensis]|uniref:hypothetical protein n=1 Tax=Cohnella mopanensis TaxID=2911966 RepID=UPI001EF8AE6C|nr:hypothetical protein [Cohnella mopanensis]
MKKTLLLLCVVSLLVCACSRSDTSTQDMEIVNEPSLADNATVPAANIPAFEPETPPINTQEKPIHTDDFDLEGQNYSVQYWNKGEFDYTRFAIMKKGNIVFDSQKQGITFEGGAGGQTDGEPWSTSLVYNHHAAFLFELVDNRPGPSVILIEEIDGEMKVTVQDNVELYFDQAKGDPLLFGFPSYGQIPLFPALIAVYVWQSDHYEASAALTTQYWEEKLDNRQVSFEKEPDDMRLDSLLSAYLLLNRIEEGTQWLDEYSQNNHSADNEYLQTYKDYLNDDKMVDEARYEHWVDNLPPLANPSRRGN